MKLYLNKNKQKIVVSDHDEEDSMVSVNNSGKIDNYLFKGFITKEGVECLKREFGNSLISLSYFFGSTAQKLDGGSKWQFNKENIRTVCVICNKVVFCLVDNSGKPYQENIS